MTPADPVTVAAEMARKAYWRVMNGWDNRTATLRAKLDEAWQQVAEVLTAEARTAVAAEASAAADRLADNAWRAARLAERQRIRDALMERQAMLAYISTNRQVAAVLVKDIADLLDGAP